MKQAVESEMSQKMIACEREQSRMRVGDTLRKQQSLIINEMVIALQRLQITARGIEDNSEMNK